MAKPKKKSLAHFFSHWDLILLIIFVTIYFATLGTLSIVRHNAFASGFDLSNMDHTVWNTMYGNFFSFKYNNEFVSRLSIHSDFILILLSPIFLIWNDVRALLLTQTFFLGVGAVPLYFLARRILKDRVLALGISAIYLLNPGLQWTNIYDFHSISFSIPFILAAFYFAYVNNWRLYALFIALALITKEQVGLTVMLIGLAVFFIFRKRRIGILTSIVGLIWVGAMMFFVIPAAGGQETHWALSGWYSAWLDRSTDTVTTPTYTKILEQFIKPEALDYYKMLLQSYGFLPVLGLPWILLGLPELSINVLSSNFAMQSIHFHYDSGIIPFLAIASVYGLSYLGKFLTLIPISALHSKFILYAILVIALGITLRLNYFYSPLPTTPSCWCYVYYVTLEDRAFEEALLAIPKDSSVTASIEIRTHLNHRRDISFVPSATSSADFVALITQHRMNGNYEPKTYENELIPILLSSKNHIVRYQSEHFYLFEKIRK